MFCSNPSYLSMQRALHFLIIIINISILTACAQPPNEVENAAQLFNEEKYNEALTIINSHLTSYPKDELAWTIKSRIHAAAGELDSAVYSINQATKTNNYEKANIYKAMIYRQANLYSDREALKILEKYQFKYTDDFEIQSIICSLYYKTNMLKEAEQGFKLILKQKPNNYNALSYLGAVNRKQNKPDIALEYLNKAIEIDSTDYFAFEQRALLYTSTHLYEKAIVDHNRLIRITKNVPMLSTIYAFTFNNRGFAKYSLGKLDEAMNDINSSLQLAPENAYAYKNRALVHLEKGNMELACEDLSKSSLLGFEEKYGDEVNALIQENCK